MNLIDFSQPGGFPLSQDRLGYMQSSYKEALGMLTKIAAVGNAPIKLWGMLFGPPTGGSGSSSAVGSISDGAFFYNGEIYQFTGGNYYFFTTGTVILVVISSSAATLTYHDGISRGAVLDRTATFTIATSVTDATHFPFDSMITFSEGVWANSTTGNFINITPATISTTSGGLVDGYVYYRKVPMIDCLHLIFQFSALHPTTLPANSSRIHVATLQVGYRPASDRYITVCGYDGPGMNDAGTADLRFGQCYITASNGYCHIDMSKFTTSSGAIERYMFNGYIPLTG